MSYGDVATGTDKCRGAYIPVEITRLKFKFDDGQVDGILLANPNSNKPYQFKAQDISEPAAVDSPVIVLPGRLIGFGLDFGKHTRGDIMQIVKIRVVYNACNCPATEFLKENAPSPMKIIAVEDSEII